MSETICASASSALAVEHQGTPLPFKGTPKNPIKRIGVVRDAVAAAKRVIPTPARTKVQGPTFRDARIVYNSSTDSGPSARLAHNGKAGKSNWTGPQSQQANSNCCGPDDAPSQSRSYKVRINDGFCKAQNKVYPWTSCVSGYIQNATDNSYLSRTFLIGDEENGTSFDNGTGIISIGQNSALVGSATWMTDANLEDLCVGDLYAMGQLGIFTALVASVPTAIDESVYNTLYYVQSVPDGNSDYFVLVPISLQNYLIWLPPFNCSTTQFPIIQIQCGSSYGLYKITNVYTATCTWDLVFTGIYGYGFYQPVHTVACVEVCATC